MYYVTRFGNDSDVHLNMVKLLVEKVPTFPYDEEIKIFEEPKKANVAKVTIQKIIFPYDEEANEKIFPCDEEQEANEKKRKQE